MRFAVRAGSVSRARVLQPNGSPPMKPILSEQEWMQIIRGEFLEIPGLRLTSDQIQRLWGLHRDTCAAILESLLHQRFLQLTADGHYVRSSSAGGLRRASPQSGPVQSEAAVRVPTKAAVATRIT